MGRARKEVEQGLVPVVLCGGGGTRLWPKSRGQVTKPFVELPSGGTLLGKTYSRTSALGLLKGLITVSSEKHLALCEKEWLDSGAAGDIPHTLVGEPASRNTGPAVAVAATVCAARHGEDAIMAVFPADHFMASETRWIQAIRTCTTHAAARKGLVLVGVMPTCAETGYGYIRKGGRIEGAAYEADRFVEKPCPEKAREYLSSGEYLWNAGIFIGRAAAFLEEISRHEPEMAVAAKQVAKSAEPGSSRILPSTDLYGGFKDISFDHAVAERARNLEVVEMEGAGWSDVGSWQSFARELLPPDDKGNRISGNALLKDSDNCTYWGDGRFAVLSGLSNVCVIDDGNAMLVSAADSAIGVGQISKELGERAPADPPTVPKPWGSYCVLSEGAGYKVKRIDIRPGARLSLQSHKRRSEHWTTILGTPTVTVEGREFQMPADRSCHIPAGAKHRIANTHPGLAAIIEVQIGDYLGEDDIVRHEDDYRRL